MGDIQKNMPETASEEISPRSTTRSWKPFPAGWK